LRAGLVALPLGFAPGGGARFQLALTNDGAEETRFAASM